MRKHLLYILCGMLLLTGCDYLNRVPEKDIETVESLFEQRTKAEAWWKGLYGEINTVLTSLTNNTSFLGADEFVTCQALYNSTTFRLDGLKVADGLQMSQSPYGSLWYKMYTVIRNANTFLENIDNTYNITDEDREWWKADVKALKAFIYFELVRRYGPICLVPQNMPMELDVSAYQLPRQHVDTCFKEIVRLLDEAAPYIPMHNQRDPAYGHTICLEALYALKAKALLYAASPLFNGNAFYSDFKNKNGELLFNSSYDRNKWLLAAEAADKAADLRVTAVELSQHVHQELVAATIFRMECRRVAAREGTNQRTDAVRVTHTKGTMLQQAAYRFQHISRRAGGLQDKPFIHHQTVVMPFVVVFLHQRVTTRQLCCDRRRQRRQRISHVIRFTVLLAYQRVSQMGFAKGQESQAGIAQRTFANIAMLYAILIKMISVIDGEEFIRQLGRQRAG